MSKKPNLYTPPVSQFAWLKQIKKKKLRQNSVRKFSLERQFRDFECFSKISYTETCIFSKEFQRTHPFAYVKNIRNGVYVKNRKYSAFMNQNVFIAMHFIHLLVPTRIFWNIFRSWAVQMCILNGSLLWFNSMWMGSMLLFQLRIFYFLSFLSLSLSILLCSESAYDFMVFGSWVTFEMHIFTLMPHTNTYTDSHAFRFGKLEKIWKED